MPSFLCVISFFITLILFIPVRLETQFFNYLQIRIRIRQIKITSKNYQLGGEYMIQVIRDKILSHFAGILAVL